MRPWIRVDLDESPAHHKANMKRKKLFTLTPFLLSPADQFELGEEAGEPSENPHRCRRTCKQKASLGIRI